MTAAPLLKLDNFKSKMLSWISTAQARPRGFRLAARLARTASAGACPPAAHNSRTSAGRRSAATRAAARSISARPSRRRTRQPGPAASFPAAIDGPPAFAPRPNTAHLFRQCHESSAWSMLLLKLPRFKSGAAVISPEKRVFRLGRRGRPLSRPPERLPFSTASRSNLSPSPSNVGSRNRNSRTHPPKPSNKWRRNSTWCRTCR